MADALAATEMVLAREQQLHALDGLAAAAAHELGTPLSTIAVVAKELARDAPPGSQFAEDLALLQTQAVRCREILKKLTRAPTEPDPLHARMSVTQLIEEAAEPLSRLRRRARRDGIARGRQRGRSAARSRSASAGPASSTASATWSRTPSTSPATRVEIAARWSAREVAHHHRRRRPGHARRRHGCPGRALRHDASGARRAVRQRMANPRAWASASSSPRPCWSAPAPPSASTIASVRSTAPSSKSAGRARFSSASRPARRSAGSPGAAAAGRRAWNAAFS